MHLKCLFAPAAGDELEQVAGHDVPAGGQEEPPAQGGRARAPVAAGAPRVEMQAGESGGGDAYLSCDPARRRSRNIQNLGLEVGVEIWQPEAGAGTQSGIA